MSTKLTETPEELRRKFIALRTPHDVANLLDIKYSILIFHVYKTPHKQRYRTFQIPKKSGGVRDICAPVTPLKIIQKKLSQVLYQVYKPRASVHGFVIQRNVVTNAKRHVRKKHVLNIDLQDFFPSINFGRVRGMFMATPYNLPTEVATVLAQICCFNNSLPQGAPTSPIVSNMLCAKLDSQLLRLAQKHRCIYTRYADDITFSTSVREFPSDLAKIAKQTGRLEVGDELERIITANNFVINRKKVRLQSEDRHQEVTGVTTNRFPNVKRQYVRQIRAMLHAWETFGLDAAESEFHAKYNNKSRFPQKDKPQFKQVVRGKIEYLGMVRGKDDVIYTQLKERFLKRAPEFRKQEGMPQIYGTALIYTEGKTDWRHLKTAISKLQTEGSFLNFQVEFREYEGTMGGPQLIAECEKHSKSPTPNSKPITPCANMGWHNSP